jgi:hypothetical protein
VFALRIGLSERVAGLAAGAYAGSPGFVFFDSQFAYESLALPLALAALFVVAYCTAGSRSLGPWVAAALLLAALVATHHITSYGLLALLLLWTSFALVRLGVSRHVVVAGGMTLMLGLAVVGWLALVAGETLPYLEPVVTSRLEQFWLVVTLQSSPRAVFQSYTGETAHPVEQVVSLLATGLFTLGIVCGAYVVLRRYRSAPVLLALAALAIALPVTTALRFVSSFSELASRFANFSFLAVCVMVALSLVWALSSARFGRTAAALTVAGLTVIVLGGIQTGWGPTYRIMPGEYRVAADSQSIEAEGLAAATWVSKNLGPKNRVTADRINSLLLGAYAGQTTVLKDERDEPLSPLFFAAQWGTEEARLLSSARVEYLVVDMRLSQELPAFGVYFEEGEPETFNHQAPMDTRALTKFRSVPGVNAIYDSGNITIYSVRRP